MKVQAAIKVLERTIHQLQRTDQKADITLSLSVTSLPIICPKCSSPLYQIINKSTHREERCPSCDYMNVELI